jgi:hypothetical protein
MHVRAVGKWCPARAIASSADREAQLIEIRDDVIVGLVGPEDRLEDAGARAHRRDASAETIAGDRETVDRASMCTSTSDRLPIRARRGARGETRP